MEIRNPINQIKTRDVIVDFFGSLVPGIVFTGIAFILFSSIIFTSVKIILLFISDSVYNFSIISFSIDFSGHKTAYISRDVILFPLLFSNISKKSCWIFGLNK